MLIYKSVAVEVDGLVDLLCAEHRRVPSTFSGTLSAWSGSFLGYDLRFEGDGRSVTQFSRSGDLQQLSMAMSSQRRVFVQVKRYNLTVTRKFAMSDLFRVTHRI